MRVRGDIVVFGSFIFGEINRFWEHFWGITGVFGSVFGKTEVMGLRKKNYKGRCEKRSVEKCVDICRTQ